jgi:Holliday junction resolvase
MKDITKCIGHSHQWMHKGEQMSLQKSNKRRGASFEIDLADWLMDKGYNAQRLPRAGRNDVGDVALPTNNDMYVIEAKAPRRDGKIDLSGWIREALVEAENYRIAKRLKVAPTPLVVIKAPNKGIEEAYVVQRLSDAIAKL